MKTTIFIAAGLLAAVILSSCDKGEKPEQEPSTKGEIPEEPAKGSDYNRFFPQFSPIPQELSFGKEGGEKIVTYSEKGWWRYIDTGGATYAVWYPGPFLLNSFWFNLKLNEVLESLGRGGIIERTEVTKAVPAAGKLIVPDGWRNEEVIGSRPKMLPTVMPDESPVHTPLDFIPLYEYELSTYTNTEGRTPEWKGFSEFVTLIDGGWCTISRAFTDWFEPYEGFAYANETFANGITLPNKGAVGKWWIPKEFTAHPPVDYPVTVRVSPNDTGEPRQFVLRTPITSGPAIIINQE